MRKSRFTEEQIIGILQESAAGATTGELNSPARDLAGNVLQLAPQVRRDARE